MGKSINEENIAYFLAKGRFGDLVVYLNRRSEILWVLQLTIVCSIVMLGGIAAFPTNSIRGVFGLAVFLMISLGLVYWYLLGRFEKKIANEIRKAEEILI